MSASERLKALDTEHLCRALPQIVAVVERGQAVLHEYDLWAEDANDGEFAIWSREQFMAEFLLLRRALSALSEALGGGDE